MQAPELSYNRCPMSAPTRPANPAHLQRTFAGENMFGRGLTVKADRGIFAGSRRTSTLRSAVLMRGLVRTTTADESRNVVARQSRF